MALLGSSNSAVRFLFLGVLWPSLVHSTKRGTDPDTLTGVAVPVFLFALGLRGVGGITEAT